MSISRIETILKEMGAAGARLDSMHAVEAGAGNISVVTADELPLREIFSEYEDDFILPVTVPSLAGRTVFVTGSGCRLRDIADSPTHCVSALTISPNGESARWFYSPQRAFAKPTSEFNSHLAVHNDQVELRNVAFQSVIHAQPPHLVLLSHIDDLRDNETFNRAILRWEPETIVQIPHGIEVLEYMIPGSETLMENNVKGLRQRIMTLWSRHGIMVRSDGSPLEAVDKVEYAETGAMYEVMNRSLGSPSKGLSDEEIRGVIEAFGVDTDLYQ